MEILLINLCCTPLYHFGFFCQVHTYAGFMYALIGVLTLIEAYRRGDVLVAAARNAVLIVQVRPL